MQDQPQDSLVRRRFNYFRQTIQRIISPKLKSDDLRDVATVYRLKEIDSSWTLINSDLKLWRYFAEVPEENYEIDDLSRFRPLLLVHGYQSNHTTWNWMANKLWADGFRIIYAFEMDDYKKGFNHNVTHLASVVDYIREIEPIFKEIDILGHSMGGALSKQFIKLLGGSSKVRLFIGLGAPLTGVYRFWKVLASLDLAEQTGIDFSDTEGLLSKINEVITDEILYTLTQIHIIGSLRRYLGTDGFFNNKPIPDMANHIVPVNHFTLNKNEEIYNLIKRLLTRKIWFYKIRLLYIQNTKNINDIEVGSEKIIPTDQTVDQVGLGKEVNKFCFKFSVKGKRMERYPRTKHIVVENGLTYIPTSPLIVYVGMTTLDEKVTIKIKATINPDKTTVEEIIDLDLDPEQLRNIEYITIAPSKKVSKGKKIELAIYMYQLPIFNF
ncbi:MAG: esterase/lipase family protein [Candidatus Hodarchaeales archaeon]|jgi:pimeloyl-ACP methyl ester carboxylesterase